MARGVAHRAEGMGVLPKAKCVQNSLEWVKTPMTSQVVWFCAAEGWDQPHSCSFSEGAAPAACPLIFFWGRGRRAEGLLCYGFNQQKEIYLPRTQQLYLTFS